MAANELIALAEDLSGGTDTTEVAAPVEAGFVGSAGAVGFPTIILADHEISAIEAGDGTGSAVERAGMAGSIEAVLGSGAGGVVPCTVLAGL